MTSGTHLRPAYADDAIALHRLAALDSAPVPPPAPLVLAEVDGTLRAALSLRDGTVIADPFFRTTDVVALLRMHAAAETRRMAPRAGERSRRRLAPRLRLALRRA